MTLPDWSFENLELLIDSRNDRVIHETGSACPVCRVDDVYGSTIMRDGAPANIKNGRIGCPRCHGIGWIYRHPQEMTGLVTSLQSGANRTLIENGWALPGDCVFSPSLDFAPISDFDRITMCVPSPVGDGNTLIRNAANLEDNQMLDTALSDDEDRLWYMADCAIWCEDQDGVAYMQNIDYEFEGKKIRWIGNRPADGKTYVINYFAYLEWIVFATPFARFDNNRSLGQKVLLRKAHAAMVNAHPGDTPAKREEEYTGLQESINI